MKSLQTLIALALVSGFAPAFAAEEETNSSTIVTPKPVEYAEHYRPHVGAQAGFANPEGSYHSGGTFGIDTGFQPYIPFAVGLELNYARMPGATADTPDFERTVLMGKGTYNFGGDITVIKDSYVGLGLGTSINRGRWNIVGAPLVGFDIPIDRTEMRTLTLGALAKYEVTGGEDPNAFTLNGMVKYWY